MNIDDFLDPKIPMPRIPLIDDSGFSSRKYEIIIEEIKAFESSLDDEHEVCLRLASFGQKVDLAVTDIGYANPDLFIFRGLAEGRPAVLIQHQSQLNFLLLSCRKPNGSRPARRIGFAVSSEE